MPQVQRGRKEKLAAER